VSFDAECDLDAFEAMMAAPTAADPCDELACGCVLSRRRDYTTPRGTIVRSWDLLRACNRAVLKPITWMAHLSSWEDKAPNPHLQPRDLEMVEGYPNHPIAFYYRGTQRPPAGIPVR